jgi:hypothetical protein
MGTQPFDVEEFIRRQRLAEMAQSVAQSPVPTNRDPRVLFEQEAQNIPNESQYHPSRFRNIMATIAGIGAGAARGSQYDIGDPATIVHNVKYGPFDRQVAQHERRMQGLKEAADERAKQDLEYSQQEHLRAQTEAEVARKGEEEAKARTEEEKRAHIGDPSKIGKLYEGKLKDGSHTVFQYRSDGIYTLNGLPVDENAIDAESLREVGTKSADPVVNNPFNKLPTNAYEGAYIAFVQKHKRQPTPEENDALIKQTKQDAASIHVEAPGTLVPMEDADGNTVLLNNKTGQTTPLPTIHKPGYHTKQEADYNKTVAPIQAATDYAHKYLTEQPSGPGDEALMERYFELAKVSSGWRMTKNQTNMLNNARSWKDSIEARGRHILEGVWYSDDQRKRIVHAMDDLAQSHMSAFKGPSGGGGQSKGSTVDDLVKQYGGK